MTPQTPKPKTHFVRDFSGGMNISTSRQAIKDNEAWYMEGLQPISPGCLKPLAGSDVTSMTALVETTDPTYAMTFQVNTTPWAFVVFASTGNGYVINMSSFATTKIFAGTLTSGSTCACQWNKLGILIVDPTGYWDYGVTSAATLTALDHSVQSITITDPGSAYTAQPTVTIAGGGGSGAAATATLGLSVVAVAAAGLGYNAGDVVTVPGVGSLSNGLVQVLTIGAGGAVATVGIVSGATGEYFAGGLPGAAAATTGGAGNGLTLNCTLNVSMVFVTNRGTGYTSAPTATLVGGGPPTRVGSITAVISGSLAGTAIASYAGRAWIANGRTVTFTDADTYASFIGSGSQFTINDSYLVNNITALFAVNAYLYIFGATSIDVLSNVTVSSADTASFSRVNVSPVIGCDYPKQVFAYYRSVAFANSFGFYMLTGATVDNVSEAKLEAITDGSMTSSIMSGFPATLNGVLCAAWSVHCSDVTSPGNQIDILVIFSRGRWYFCRQATDTTHFVTPRCSVSIPQGAFGFRPFTFDRTLAGPNTKLYSMFTGTTRVWRLYTKLYDLGSPMTSKLATAMGVGLNMRINGPVFTSLAVDTEQGVGTAVTNVTSAAGGYNSMINVASGVPGNARCLGWQFTTTGGTSSAADRIEWLALQYTEMNTWQ